jgi:hypothetical protein
MKHCRAVRDTGYVKSLGSCKRAITSPGTARAVIGLLGLGGHWQL